MDNEQTINDLPDEAQTEETPRRQGLAEAARKLYGDKYKEPGEVEEEPNEDRPFRGVRDAAKALRQGREAADTTEADDSADDGADDGVPEPSDGVFSGEDLEVYHNLKQYGSQWHEDFQKLEAFKQKTDISQLSDEDKATLEAAEAEMEERRKVLEQAANSLEGRATKQVVTREVRALHRKVPDLKDEANVRAVVDHMKSLGGSDQEIAQIRDHRVFQMAWESMQFRKMKNNTGKTPTTKVPKFKKGAKRRGQAPAGDIAQAEAKFKQRPTLDSGLALLTARRNAGRNK